MKRRDLNLMDDLTGKRIVILGLARQGRALARFAAQQGATVIVSDLRSENALRSSLEELSNLEIKYVLGEHPVSLLDGADMLAISGGVPTTVPIVGAARQRGIPVTNDSLEFMKRSPALTIGITGSAGKTTTTALTGAMGQAAGRSTWVGGNIGRPLIDELYRIEAGDLVVQELSSFQLELWSLQWGHEKGYSPAITAVLNITPNHLDRHGTMAAYSRAKANILRYQAGHDVAVLSADDPGAMALQPEVRGRLRTFSMEREVDDGAFLREGQIWLKGGGAETPVASVGEVRLRGWHNLANVLAAATLADAAGIPSEAISRAIGDFTGVAHRLEIVATKKGVTYVNDSIATAPERALAALASFDEPLVLLAGGRDKDMQWEVWTERVAERVRHVVLFGALAPMLEARLQQHRRRPGDQLRCVTRVQSLDEAVRAAAAVAERGDVVLLAPGGTSYDAFLDFEERGERFRELVRAL